MRDTNNEGAADYNFRMGIQVADWQAIAGDWDASGSDTVGIFRQGRFYLSNNLDGTGLGSPFQFGPIQSGWQAIAGDWNADGTMTIGLYNQSIWRLRNTNTAGGSDIGFNFGIQGTDWQLLASYRGGEQALAMMAQSIVDTPLSS
ncbi:MAG: hypothetical protein Q9P01_18575 [Anaerolineae bacterium]|nr:hypothetical protein [Anaerolineae bacterium]MDQ7036760.1 hypothetical protein [Anaerolineae bacterium]